MYKEAVKIPTFDFNNDILYVFDENNNNLVAVRPICVFKKANDDDVYVKFENARNETIEFPLDREFKGRYDEYSIVTYCLYSRTHHLYASIADYVNRCNYQPNYIAINDFITSLGYELDGEEISRYRAYMRDYGVDYTRYCDTNYSFVYDKDGFTLGDVMTKLENGELVYNTKEEATKAIKETIVVVDINGEEKVYEARRNGVDGADVTIKIKVRE